MRQARRDGPIAVPPNRAIAQASRRLLGVLQSHGPHAIAFGLSAVVALQALIILGGTLELIPLTGITLPFVSYGGSSVVSNFVIVGVLLRISADA